MQRSLIKGMKRPRKNEAHGQYDRSRKPWRRSNFAHGLDDSESSRPWTPLCCLQYVHLGETKDRLLVLGGGYEKAVVWFPSLIRDPSCDNHAPREQRVDSARAGCSRGILGFQPKGSCRCEFHSRVVVAPHQTYDAGRRLMWIGGLLKRQAMEGPVADSFSN